MKRKLPGLFTIIFSLLLVVALAGCGGQTEKTTPTTTEPSEPSSGTSTQPMPVTSNSGQTPETSVQQVASTGTVQMWVTDAPRSDNVTEIWVTVSKVEIHKSGTGQQSSDNVSNEAEGQADNSTDTADWISANLTGPNRFDLLTLRGESGGIQQILTTANMTVGKYTQIRMTIEKVEVKIDGVLKDGTLPSGKLKFVHPFDIEAGKETKLLFDFDADKFVNVTGAPNDPKITVKPTVKMIVSKPQAAQAGEGQEGKPGVEITTTSLPDGVVGALYSVNLTAAGGTTPYTWNLQGGNLPNGLTLSSSGLISGTSDNGTAGNYNLTVKVSDNSTPVKNDTEHFTLTVTGG